MPDRPHSVLTMQAHHSCVYQALFSPHQPDLLASGSADGTVKIFDLRSQIYVPPPGGVNTNFVAPLTAAVLTIPASTTEVLSIDWNKYRSFVLASASVDKAAKVWDFRMIKIGEVGQAGGQCEAHLLGHEYAVRKVQWSPHRADVLSTASYDMTCRVYASCRSFFDQTHISLFRWSTTPPPGRLLYIHDPHTEFVAGCGWSLYEEGVLASCGWDGRLHVFRP